MKGGSGGWRGNAILSGMTPIFLLAAGLACASGGTAPDAVNFVTGARAAGMGGAAVAAVDDVTALQWNPAGLIRPAGWSASLSHLAWVAGISYSYLGVSSSLPSLSRAIPGFEPGKGIPFSAGGSIQRLDYGTIESTRGLSRAVDASDWGLNAGLAAGLTPALSAGAVMKGWFHSLDDASVGEGALDLGGAYDAVPGLLRLGAVVQNIGYAGEMAGHRPPLPISLKAGAAWSFRALTEPLPIEGEEEPWSPDFGFTVAGDVTAYQKGEPVDIGIGLEADMNGILLGRVGYLRAVKDTGGGAGVSLGLGLRVFGMRLDYAMVSVGDLGRGQFVTLSWATARAVGPATSLPAAAAGNSVAGPDAPASGARAAVPETAKPVSGSAAGGAVVPADAGNFVSGPDAPASGAGASVPESAKPDSGPPKTVDVEREYADASALYAAGDMAGARAKLEAMLAASPGHWQGWQLLGNARYGLGDRAGALEAYLKSLELNPGNEELKKWVESLAGRAP